MKVFIPPERGAPIKMWTDYVPVEKAALQQLSNVAQLPFIFRHVAVMPDVHFGKGATVGSVIATKGAVIPAAVGVDIGCGMMACKLSLKANDLPDNLHAIRTDIEAAVPHGFETVKGYSEKGNHVSEKFETDGLIHGIYANDGLPFFEKYGINVDNIGKQVGTLGGGNHFIELCLDLEGNVWVMLHSGSRGIGNKIGSFFIEKAKEEMKRWFCNVPDQDLAYLPEGTDLFEDYCTGVEWAQGYAALNRRAMLDAVLGVLSKHLPPFRLTEEAINCHHNYISKENHFGENVLVTRKGAVQARAGTLGIIPGSMGARSFIVRGLGNRESFCSCSHGAGRVMSRAEAKRTISLEEHVKATEGIECRKDEAVIDESPKAYKNIEDVMRSQDDLVEVVAELRQVLCVKG